MIVEPPSTIRPALTSATAARAIPSMSTPSWAKKRRSSTAIVAFRIHGDMPSTCTGWRFRSAGIEPSRLPSAAKRNEFWPIRTERRELRSHDDP